MELISKNDGLLTNIEVLEVIRENRKQSSIHISNSSAQVELQNREYVENKAINYITGSVVGKYDSHTIGKCISAIKKLNYNLTEGELVQIANLRPTSEVEYYLIIEECSERLNDDQVAELRDTVLASLGNT